jgi:hypothetical protein
VQPAADDYSASLGVLKEEVPSQYLVELSLPIPSSDTKYVLASLEVVYDSGTGLRESTGGVPLEVTFSSTEQGTTNFDIGEIPLAP